MSLDTPRPLIEDDGMPTGDLSDAILLATNAHRGQVDKGGHPYILHPLRVMQAVEGDDARIVAVLHDVVEDCDVEPRLIRHRFGPAVADAVDALTHRTGETYEAFIDRCTLNPIARVVKLADIADNLDTTRLPRPLTDADWKRIARYERAVATIRKASGRLTG